MDWWFLPMKKLGILLQGREERWQRSWQALLPLWGQVTPTGTEATAASRSVPSLFQHKKKSKWDLKTLDVYPSKWFISHLPFCNSGISYTAELYNICYTLHGPWQHAEKKRYTLKRNIIHHFSQFGASIFTKLHHCGSWFCLNLHMAIWMIVT